MREVILFIAAAATAIITLALCKGAGMPARINVDAPEYKQHVKGLICQDACSECEDKHQCYFADKEAKA